MSKSLRVATWNAEWASPRDSRGQRVTKVLEDIKADIIVLTEGCSGLLPTDGFTLEGSNDWGYQVDEAERRKVILWSRFELLNVDTTGHSDLPSGRYVSASINCQYGSVRVHGVCIPWSDAHVRTGRMDRKRWEDHNIYLSNFKKILKVQEELTLVAGDFNQRIPRKRQPLNSYNLLSDAISDLTVHTTNTPGLPLIDHVATSPQMTASNIEIIENFDKQGQLSDHRGVVTNLALEPVTEKFGTK